ncbi:PDZ domain-containing protein [Nocardioides salsibiostraticola]
MSQRTIAALTAGPLLLILVLTAAFAPLPYATYSPGPTVDVLGEDSSGEETIQIPGQKTYQDDGQLRLTTVFVSGVDANMSMMDLLQTWISDDRAVYPYDLVHPDGETQEDSDRDGAVAMVTSQDAAVAVALTELGYDLNPTTQVSFVDPGKPSNGKLKVRDKFVAINGTDVSTLEDVFAAISETPTGQDAEVTVLRGKQERTMSITPIEVDGSPQIGINIGVGFEFPFEVDINVDPDIGGPSAGLMFALSVYDTLTPESLSGGSIVAGTGTITAEGLIGPIGGIQQKIAGARDSGASLFLVPRDNCGDAVGAANGDMRLVMATNFSDATDSLEAYAEDPEADLPSCDDREAVQ